MRKRVVFIFFIFLNLSNIYAIDFNFDRSDYDESIYSKNIEDIISLALNTTLVTYTKVDVFLQNPLNVHLTDNSYEEDLLKVAGVLSYNNKELLIKVEFYEDDEKLAYEKLENILINTFRYDLSSLFGETDDYFIKYSGKNDSFYNKKNKYIAGDLIYLQKEDNPKASLAVVDSIYNDYATINYLYNPTNLINTKINDGPKHQIGLNGSFDYEKNILVLGGEYFYLKGFFYPFDTTYLGLSSSYYYNLNDYSTSFVVDMNLLLELPLSVLLKSTKILNNSSVYTKFKIGTVVDTDLELHSAFEIGYKLYFSSQTKMVLGYKMDSNNEIYKNILIGFEILF